jgi:hypothetical protein
VNAPLDNQFLEVARTKWDPKKKTFCFYFVGSPLAAKFGSFLLWMITQLQKIENKNPGQ